HSVPQNPKNPKVTLATATTLTDGTANFPTEYGGLAGLAAQAISPGGHVQFRLRTANTASTLTVATPWDTIPDSTYTYRFSAVPEDQTDGVMRGPRVAWSINREVGGTDIINGGGGADVIVGGASGDTINAGAGDD